MGWVPSRAARADGGEFKDLFDFCRRIDLKKINRRSLEAMVRAGVLDKLGPKSSFHDRAQLLATLPDAIAAADQDARNEAAGIMDMFGAVDDSPATAVEWKPARAWNDETRLNGERDTLGLFLTGHPIDQYEKEVRQFVTARINSLQPTGKGEAATIAGLVVALRITRSKRSGDRMAFITLDDKTGRVEVSVFGKTFAEYGELVQKDTLLIFKGGVRNDEYTGGFNLVADPGKPLPAVCGWRCQWRMICPSSSSRCCRRTRGATRRCCWIWTTTLPRPVSGWATNGKSAPTSHWWRSCGYALVKTQCGWSTSAAGNTQHASTRERCVVTEVPGSAIQTPGRGGRATLCARCSPALSREA